MNMRNVLYNTILGWYDDSPEPYHGLEDKEFVRRVCERTGISEEEYMDLIKKPDREEFFILSNNSECDDLSIYRAVGTAEDVYKKMQALVLTTAKRAGKENYVTVHMDSCNMTASIYWGYSQEEFRIVRSSIVTSIDEADGVAEINLCDIEDDIHWDNEEAQNALFSNEKLVSVELEMAPGIEESREHFKTTIAEQFNVGDIVDMHCGEQGIVVEKLDDTYIYLLQCNAHIEKVHINDIWRSDGKQNGKAALHELFLKTFGYSSVYEEESEIQIEVDDAFIKRLVCGNS